MAKALLTHKTIEALKPLPGHRSELFDSKVTGLSVRVTENGTKSYCFNYTYRRKRRRLSLGRVESITLAAAREKTRKLRRDLESAGVDPGAEKSAQRSLLGAPTIQRLADEYIERHLPSKKRQRDDLRNIRSVVLPAWGSYLTHDVGRSDVTALLDSIHGNTQANRIRALLSKMFNVGIKYGLVEHNPVFGTDRRKETPRDRVLTEDEIRQAWVQLEARSDSWSLGLQLLLLTGQRPGEVFRKMRWHDIQLEDRAWVWTIPREDTKNQELHRVPLSRQAVRLLEQRRKPTAGSPWVFPGKDPDNPVVENGWSKHVRSLWAETNLEPFSAHDLRRTVLTRLASMGVTHVVIAAVANHKQLDITGRVYVRYTYDKEKRRALQAWGRRLETIVRHGVRSTRWHGVAAK